MLIVDRIEGSAAICDENGEMRDIPIGRISANVKPGDILVDCGDGTFFTVDIMETALRRDKLRQRFKNILETQSE